MSRLQPFQPVPTESQRACHHMELTHFSIPGTQSSRYMRNTGN